jgi:hypothetical protein
MIDTTVVDKLIDNSFADGYTCQDEFFTTTAIQRQLAET